MAEREVHLRDYIAVIRKHSFVVIISFLLVFGAALIVSLYMPRVFEATATIEVQSSSSKSSGLPNLMQSVMSSGVDQVSMQTVCRRFISRPILAEAIRNLKKTAPEMTGVPDVPEALASRIRMSIVPDTRMIEVTVKLRRNEGGSQWAVRIANELISVMQSHQSAKTDAEIEGRQTFISGKMSDAVSQISDSDQKIMQFLKDSGGPLVWSAQSEHLLGRLTNTIERKERSEMLIASEERKLEELNAKLQEEPEWIESSRTFTRDQLWDKHRTELVNLRRDLAAARTDSGEKNPKVESLEAQIREVEAQMKDTAQMAASPSGRTEARNSMYNAILDQIIGVELSLIAYRTSLEISEARLNELDSEVEKMFLDLPEKQFELATMNQEARYKVAIYESLLGKELAAEIWANERRGDTSGKTKGGIEIVDTAQPGGRPVSPRVNFIGAVAGLIGLMIGLAMAFLAEYFENT